MSLTVLERVFHFERPKRKKRKQLEQEKTERLENMLKETNDEKRGLEVRDLTFMNKGRGVFSNRKFERGQFVVEYAGYLCKEKEAKEREKMYADDCCFSYYFKSG